MSETMPNCIGRIKVDCTDYSVMPSNVCALHLFRDGQVGEPRTMACQCILPGPGLLPELLQQTAHERRFYILSILKYFCILLNLLFLLYTSTVGLVIVV